MSATAQRGKSPSVYPDKCSLECNLPLLKLLKLWLLKLIYTLPKACSSERRHNLSLGSAMKLTNTQIAALTAAAARDNGSILPLPASIRGGAIGKVCDALEVKGLARKIGETDKQTLVISDDGRRALGLEVEPAVAAEAKPAQKGRTGTKQAQLIAMLGAPEGASTEEIVAAFGWQPHTVRGAIAGALKKKLGLQVASEAIEGRGRVYRILPVSR